MMSKLDVYKTDEILFKCIKQLKKILNETQIGMQFILLLPLLNINPLYTDFNYFMTHCGYKADVC